MPNALGSATHSHFSLLVSVDMAKKAARIVEEWAAQNQKDVSIVIGPYTKPYLEIFADGVEWEGRIDLNAENFSRELSYHLDALNNVAYPKTVPQAGRGLKPRP
jgi:hypothetical protein